MEDRKIRSFPLSFATFLLFHDTIEFLKKMVEQNENQTPNNDQSLKSIFLLAINKATHEPYL
jgi:hypothetical protein